MPSAPIIDHLGSDIGCPARRWAGPSTLAAAGQTPCPARKNVGFPAYYAGETLCICLHERGIGVKFPQQTTARLLETDPNTIPFQPMGKHKMRQWVQINPSRSEDYRQYASVFDESIGYVLAQP
jgi:hypothetical protein